MTAINTAHQSIMAFSPDKTLPQHYERLGSLKDEGILQLRAIFIYLLAKCPDLRRIQISYDGSGDSGQIEKIYYLSDRFSYSDQVIVDDSEILPDEIACGHEVQKGAWSQIHHKWINDEEPRNEGLREALDRIAWDIVYGQNPGFEMNEGGFGSLYITLDPDKDPSELKIQLEHSERVETTNDYSYSL
jgi:hypothetical protein